MGVQTIGVMAKEAFQHEELEAECVFASLVSGVAHPRVSEFYDGLCIGAITLKKIFNASGISYPILKRDADKK